MLLLVACQPPPPEAAAPADLQALEPAVGELINTQLAVLEQNPGDAEAHGILGLIYAANSMWALANKSFENAAKIAPAEYLWRYHLALSDQEIGAIDKSIEILQELTQEAPGFAPAYNRLGELLLQQGNLNDAEAAYQRVMTLQPTAPHGKVGLAEVHIHRGDSAAAIPILEQVTRTNPDYRVANYLLGVAYRNSGRGADARPQLERGSNAKKQFLSDPYSSRIETYKVSSAARNRRAVQLLRAGKAAEASQVFRKMLESDPDNVTILNNLAIALMRQEKFADAEEALNQALAVNSSKFTTYSNLSSLALRRGDVPQALAFSREAVARAPDRYESHFWLGRILLSDGNLEGAISSLRNASRLNKGHVAPHLYLGEAYLRSDQPEAAIEQFELALRLEPGLPRAHAGMVRAGLQNDDLDSAGKHLEVLERTVPSHPDVKRYRAILNDARK